MTAPSRKGHDGPSEPGVPASSLLEGSIVSATDSDEAASLLRVAAAAEGEQRYVLRLYVTGTTQVSLRAIERVQRVCEQLLLGRYELEVIDLFQRPTLAKGEQIIATPTLIRLLPPPLRRLVGDMASVDNMLVGIDLRRALT